jgi:hypothetical protein
MSGQGLDDALEGADARDEAAHGTTFLLYCAGRALGVELPPISGRPT